MYYLVGPEICIACRMFSEKHLSLFANILTNIFPLLSSPVSPMNGHFKAMFQVKLYQLKELCFPRVLNNECAEYATNDWPCQNHHQSKALSTQRALFPRRPEQWTCILPQCHKQMSISGPSTEYDATDLKSCVSRKTWPIPMQSLSQCPLSSLSF